MAAFEKAIDHVLRWEGGYVNHPNDPGGATNRGITIGVFQKYALSILGVAPSIEALMALTEAEAKAIYWHVFWQGIDGDEIKSQEVANIYFDAFVNMGNSGVKVMQKTLNVMGARLVVDGVHGPLTLAAINAANPVQLYNNFKAARIWYYKDLAQRKPTMVVFLQGWLNRINSFADLIEKKNSGSAV